MVNVHIKKNGKISLRTGQPVRGVKTLNNELLICTLEGDPVAIADTTGLELRNSYGVVFEEGDDGYVVHLVMPEYVRKEKSSSWSVWDARQEVMAL